MTVCEMCGKAGPLYTAMVEGTQLKVCEGCGKFGRIVAKPVVVQKKTVQKTPDLVEELVEDFAKIIREARERQNVTQKDFALKLNEKESAVQKWESGAMSPSIDTAKKLEKLLKVKLVIKEAPETAVLEKKASGPLTIGDLLIKKK
jgi:putative transcription factor